MSYNSNLIAQIKSKISLTQIISKRVKLTRKGKALVGLCPFHHEKSPSFNVVEDKGFYHCFGCGASGDAIEFIANTSGAKFNEIIEDLAKEAGIIIPLNHRQDDKSQDLYQLMDSAKIWYQQQLKYPKNQHALDYLLRRNISLEMIEKFSLGFALVEKDALYKFLSRQGALVKDLLEVGLVIKTDSGEIIDRFRKRIMFPIINAQNKVIAFGGRACEEKIQPKYLNSPETPLFKKREVFFAENFAKAHAYTKKRLFVVEGYLDAIAMHAAGYEETVASLGTALSVEHINKMWKYASQPIICLDGDAAGLRAMNKVANLALSLLKDNYSLSFIELPTGMDPDELLKNRGREFFNQLIEKKINLSQAIWLSEFKELPLNASPEQKSSLEKRLMSLAETIPDKIIKSAYRSFFLQQLWHNVKKQINKVKQTSINYINTHLTSIASCVISDIQRMQRTMLIIILNYPHLLQDYEIEEEFSNIEFSEIALNALRENILQLYHLNHDITKEQLIKVFENQQVYLDISKWGEGNVAFFKEPAKLIWQYSLSKYHTLVLENEYVVKLEAFTEDSMEKAEEIRKQIIIQKNNIQQMEQLLLDA
jgi:DNA primase